VRDNGIGIEASALGKVFNMFFQVDTSLERTQDGLGIGLSLVKVARRTARRCRESAQRRHWPRQRISHAHSDTAFSGEPA